MNHGLHGFSQIFLFIISESLEIFGVDPHVGVEFVLFTESSPIGGVPRQFLKSLFSLPYIILLTVNANVR